MPKKGQPVKFDTIKKTEFLDLLSAGGRRGASAKAVGVHRATVVDHMKKDLSFAKAVSEAERDANELMEDALFQSGLAGNVTAQQVWLYNRDSDSWTDRRQVKLGGEIGIKGPLVIVMDDEDSSKDDDASNSAS